MTNKYGCMPFSCCIASIKSEKGKKKWKDRKKLEEGDKDE